jgi:hypothetical protein
MEGRQPLLYEQSLFHRQLIEQSYRQQNKHLRTTIVIFIFNKKLNCCIYRLILLCLLLHLNIGGLMGLMTATALVAATGPALVDALLPRRVYEDVKNCYDTLCPDIDVTKLRPIIEKALDALSANKAPLHERWITGYKKETELLRLQSSDPRKKFLFITAEDDVCNGLQPKDIAGIVNELDKHFDVKYTTAGSSKKLCKEIADAAKTGTVSGAIFHTRGSHEWIVWGNTENEDGWLDEKTADLKNCFSGISPSGQIVLFAPYTGANGTESLAQKIADVAKRHVIAPSEAVDPSWVSFSKGNFLTIHHTSKEGWFKNAFKWFAPRYTECQTIHENKLHPREKEAADVLLKSFQEKGLLPATAGFEEAKQFLQLCTSEQEKVLFLSAKPDKDRDPSKSGALNASNYKEFLSVLAYTYDLRFKVINSYEDICIEIKKAAKRGIVKYVIINAHGEKTAYCVRGYCEEDDDWVAVKTPKDWDKCFEGIKDRLVLLTCSSGKTEGCEKATIARLIAEIAKKTVIAPTEDLFAEKIELRDAQEMDVYHPSADHSFWNRITFQEPKNVFKKFNP